MAHDVDAVRRTPLSRDRVLLAAVALADEAGVEALSMRNLAQRLGVVPMALYKHVANKDELLDGMIDAVVGQIDAPVVGADWKTAIRSRILSARQAQLRHPWASRVIESRTNPTPVLLEYMDSIIGTLRAGGLSVDLTHHVMHALGSRILGFTQELFNDGPPVDPQIQRAAAQAMAAHYPNVAEIAMAAAHDDGTIVGAGCDDQFEFEFALDLLLDGIERLQLRQWTSTGARAA